MTYRVNSLVPLLSEESQVVIELFSHCRVKCKMISSMRENAPLVCDSRPEDLG